jgi:hypothetical protein
MNSTPTLPHGLRNLDRKTKLALAIRLTQRPVRQTANLDKFTRYQSDPVAYAREVLGVTLTADQVAVAESVRDNRYTLVKASHSTGKTHVAALLASWWYDCWAEHIVYITAPTWGQAQGLTFAQVQRFRLGGGLPGQILESGWVRDHDARFKTSHFIRTLNAERREGFQGQHAAPILIVLEEATGIPPYIWAATTGLMTNENCRCLAIGNPTDEATPYGAAASSALWNVLTINGLRHPNVEAQMQGLPPPVPEAISLRWLADSLRENCEVVQEPDPDCFEFFDLAAIEAALAGEPVPADAAKVLWRPNGVFQGTVLGGFPTQASESVIPRGWLEALPVLVPTGLPEIGCDVARFGDDRTTLCVRVGPCVMEMQEIRKMDTVAVTGAVVDLAQRWAERATAARKGEGGPVDPKSLPIRIDVTGGLGTGPFDILHNAGYQVAGVNSSEKAIEPEKYHNRRSELWFATQERVKKRELDLSRLPRELREKLVRELAVPHYRNDAGGKKVVEAKEVTKKRLGYSPDLADALNLAFTGTRKLFLFGA